VLITEPFQAVVASNALKLGVPGYHTLVVPHPIWGKDDDELRALVEDLNLLQVPALRLVVRGSAR
jgi:hypothetical protein